MKQKRMDLLWGAVLVLLGALFLAQNLGWIPDLAPLLWSLLFAGVGVVFLLFFLTQGPRQWWWLFPGLGSGAIALTIWMGTAGVEGTLIGALFMGIISVPFWVAYFADRQQNWWALIPGWATAVIAFVVLLADTAPGEIIGSLIMFGIALPFLVVYFSNRKHWWALIPAGVMGTLGVIILLSSVARGELVGALFMFGIALPFFIVYTRNRQHWWALIPAGVLSSIGMVVVLSMISLPDALEARLLGGVIFLGIALTFGVLWLLRDRYPTEWARYPAIGLGVAALVAFLFGEGINSLWPALLIGLGAWLLLDNLRQPGLKK